jgi:hypothetical protein
MVPDASAWIMFGPDSKVVKVGASPASLSQPSPLATKTGAAPITGITPMRTGTCWAAAGKETAVTARPAMRAKALNRMRIVRVPAGLTPPHGTAGAIFQSPVATGQDGMTRRNGRACPMLTRP